MQLSDRPVDDCVDRSYCTESGLFIIDFPNEEQEHRVEEHSQVVNNVNLADRRPGYMLSVEPTVTWARGAHSVSLAMPWAVERNRQRSVADLQNGRHGDAAFPDYLFLASYSRRF